MPLASYRARELAHMADNFFGPDPGYHVARRSFVHKLTSADTAVVRQLRTGSALVA